MTTDDNNYVYLCSVTDANNMQIYIDKLKAKEFDVKVYNDNETKEWLFFIMEYQLQNAQIELANSEVKIAENLKGYIYNTENLERFNEWSENMYVPGYYTGGRIPYFTFRRKAKFFSGICLTIPSSIFLIQWGLGNYDFDIQGAFFCILFFTLGIFILYITVKSKNE